MRQHAVVTRSGLQKALLALPPYWPIEWSRQLRKRRGAIVFDWLTYVREAAAISVPPPSDGITPNTLKLDLDTMLLRDFSDDDAPPTDVPVICSSSTGWRAVSSSRWASGSP